MPGKSRSRISRRKVHHRRQRGGEGSEGMATAKGMEEGMEHPAAATGGADAAPAMTGGRRSSRRRSANKKAKKGGEGIIATAALPFGLLALQRYFKGSRSTKKNVRGLGNTFKRTFRRRR
jgi:hypothetical protein